MKQPTSLHQYATTPWMGCSDVLFTVHLIKFLSLRTSHSWFFKPWHCWAFCTSVNFRQESQKRQLIPSFLCFRDQVGVAWRKVEVESQDSWHVGWGILRCRRRYALAVGHMWWLQGIVHVSTVCSPGKAALFPKHNAPFFHYNTLMEVRWLEGREEMFVVTDSST